ncbi:MAG: hypothetical protein AAF267_23040 [Deinococcota bacterium]
MKLRQLGMIIFITLSIFVYAQPQSEMFAETDFNVLEDERVINGYTIQTWRSEDTTSLFAGTIVLVEAPNGEVMQYEDAILDIADVTGTDITGTGVPNLVLESFSGGAHCCFTTAVLELTPVPQEVLTTPYGECGGDFVDLDDNGTLEYRTCDDSFAYEYCSYASSPLVLSIMSYDASLGQYVAAGPSYPAEFAGEIAWGLRRALDNFAGFNEYEDSVDGTPKCEVLGLILAYLYAGDIDLARAALDRFYEEPDKELFWKQILERTSASYFYTSGE